MRPDFISAGFAALLAFSTGIPGQPQDLASPSEQQSALAFPDAAGSRLLSTDDVSKPEALRTAVCSGGRQYRFGSTVGRLKARTALTDRHPTILRTRLEPFSTSTQLGRFTLESW